jgi:hypothetical protein
MTNIQIIFGPKADSIPDILASSSLQSKARVVQFSVGCLIFTVMFCHLV